MVMKPMAIVSGLSVEYIEYQRSGINRFGKLRPIEGIRNISFNLERGDIIALIGKNGAGKSTLLKAIGGQIRPSKGSVELDGRAILLAGSDPGFFPDSTGRQNVTELAKAYGVSDKDLHDFCKSIFDFASLGEAIGRNVRGYSTGMRGKLGFGFMTALSPEVLLIDETLAVGDAEFRKKAQSRLTDFIKKSGSVIISTHSLGLARQLCNRGLILDSGDLVFDGTIEDALAKYRTMVG